MPTTLATGRSPQVPPTMAKMSSGDLVIADGVNEMKRWDGVTSALRKAGVDAPGSGPTGTPGGGGNCEVGDYTIAFRYITETGAPSALSPLVTVTTTAGQKIDWSSITLSTDAQVITTNGIQIFRSQVGVADVLHLVAHLNNTGTPTYADTASDATLSAAFTIRVLNRDGTVNADRYEPPPSHKAALVAHQDRAWYAVDAELSIGCLAVTNASTTFTAYGLQLTDEMVGWRVIIKGQTSAYLIATINTGANTGTFTVTYAGSTAAWVEYGLRPPIRERHLVYFSEAGEPFSVYQEVDANTGIQEGNAFRLSENRDTMVAMEATESGIYVAMRRSLYLIGCDSCDPAMGEQAIRIADRGAASLRSFASAGGAVYWLDESGVYRTVMGQVDESIDLPIRDIFRSGAINWNRRQWFHGVYDRRRNEVLFFVVLGGGLYPEHALVLELTTGRWHVDAFPRMAASSCLANLGGRESVVVGSESGKVYELHGQECDAPTAAAALGTATSATLVSLSDSAASFSSAAVNAPLVIVSGRGKGQVRRIVAASATRLTICDPWLIVPDATSQYQIGGIPWRIRLRTFDIPTAGNVHVTRSAAVVFQPTTLAVKATAKLFFNFDTEARRNVAIAMPQSTGQVKYVPGLPDIEIDLKRSRASGDPRKVATGQVSLGEFGRAASEGMRDHAVSLELSGAKGVDAVAVHEVTIQGVA